MTKALRVAILLLAVVLLATGVASVVWGADPAPDERAGNQPRVAYHIEAEQIVYEPKDFWVDGPYFTYEWNGQVYGVLPSDKTCRTKDFVSARIDHREPMQGLEPAGEGQWDAIGSWLNGIYEDPQGRMHGYYHGETRKDPISPARNRASLGYAYSDDGGRTWTKPGHPDNRIIIGQNGQDYAGDGHLVVRKDQLYLYFGQMDGEYLGLSKIEDKGLPGTWRTFTKSGPAGEIDTVPSMEANGSVLLGLRYAAFVTWNTHLKRWLAVDGDCNGEKDRPLILKVSDDGIHWSKLSELPPPVLPQTHAKLTLYPSLVGIDGKGETGKEFWLYYVYLTSPNTLARVKVILTDAGAAPR